MESPPPAVFHDKAKRTQQGDLLLRSAAKGIACFTAFSSQRHLVLTGAEGTGKMVVALQVATILVSELEADDKPGKGPVPGDTAAVFKKKNPLLNYYLDANTSGTKTKLHDTLKKIKGDHCVSESEEMLKYLCVVLTCINIFSRIS